MSKSTFLVACVGKPSAGKSTFLNAVTDATAKMGNYPFTTIEPNRGVAYHGITCPCARFQKSTLCRPRHGHCDQGKRFVPIEILDIAGLVPGASQGIGLGNQFLDDLRHADALIHVVDVSGTTDAHGKATVGYDPSDDIDWLRQEIHAWIFHNLMRKWPGTVRRHLAIKATPAETLQQQLSGYGTTLPVVISTLEQAQLTSPLDQWDEDTVHRFVATFLKVRFPMVIALNKIDSTAADQNVSKLMRKYPSEQFVLTSALVEHFLKTLRDQGYIHYREGEEDFTTADDDPAAGLKPLDEKLKGRLNNVRDLVLFRYGSTGCQDVLSTIMDTLHVIPVFPVKNIRNFASEGTPQTDGIFRDCVLIRSGITVREFAWKMFSEAGKLYHTAETVGGIQVSLLSVDMFPGQ
ncbi:hypothetical protein IWQ62_004904 [Dispira parvispora]|uniref:OBG-type G domain-containing protein n=1 Tax=Dispira parvispora TaxID=1520584 RepID=A0A9W8E501_9FUNG|nr:hypothetical protein IWQ62_004904 [Dispira parvispora]